LEAVLGDLLMGDGRPSSLASLKIWRKIL